MQLQNFISLSLGIVDRRFLRVCLHYSGTNTSYTDKGFFLSAELIHLSEGRILPWTKLHVHQGLDRPNYAMQGMYFFTAK